MPTPTPTSTPRRTTRRTEAPQQPVPPGYGLAQPGAFEMSFTMINGVLFDGAAQWVATNTPISLLRMVARSRTLGAYVKTTDLEAQVDPSTRSAQRGMKEYPLGAFLHALARMADCRLPKEG